jgi:hypothetical protein
MTPSCRVTKAEMFGGPVAASGIAGARVSEGGRLTQQGGQRNDSRLSGWGSCHDALGQGASSQHGRPSHEAECDRGGDDSDGDDRGYDGAREAPFHGRDERQGGPETGLQPSENLPPDNQHRAYQQQKHAHVTGSTLGAFRKGFAYRRRPRGMDRPCRTRSSTPLLTPPRRPEAPAARARHRAGRWAGRHSSRRRTPMRAKNALISGGPPGRRRPTDRRAGAWMAAGFGPGETLSKGLRA